MNNIPFNDHLKFDNKEKVKKESELLSLKINDGSYKKNIGKFLEILSAHFI